MVFETNSEKLEQDLATRDLNIVYITAKWCGPCRMLSPVMDRASIDFSDSLSIFKMDADENMDYLKNLGVRSVPTLIMYQNGVEVERRSDVKDRMKLEDFIGKYLQTTEF
jgi:thioredoxin 1